MGGKFLFVGDEKLYIRGVTYGTFRPGSDGHDYPDRSTVERDLAAMAASGINTLRVYTVPPRWLLDAALEHGLRVMVGLPWEQHVTFLEERKRARDIEQRVRAGVRACAAHPAVLCFLIGNEIPASIVRWYGARRIERFLRRLYDAAKSEDPAALVSYANYPSTEYLDLPFLDFVCFNVYLESDERLAAYLARLHNLAGDRPLLMGEVGLDSRRNGEDRQAYVLYSQVRTAFGAGCAGVVLFSWTDEWHRGGHDVEDWDFGLTTRQRSAKPALAAVAQAFAEVPFPPDTPWPLISVVVCSFNGERTIDECCRGLSRLNYPNFEVIVVDDGSNDATAAIAREFGFTVISTENRGLSSARNTGAAAARGEIVAYIDDDAFPDPEWLQYLAWAFMRTDAVGVGGPNIPPPDDPPIARCVAKAPGGPTHVLLSDRDAEHIPGCNMALRRACLEAIGGFDPRFRTAGDDVDLCWRLQARGGKIGFSPSAMVWHRRRNSIVAYWKQQQGYGKAEALLERKWPHKYNTGGHHTWSGRIYASPAALGSSFRRGRVLHGPAGTGLFQSVYQPAPASWEGLTLIPECYLVLAGLVGLTVLGITWRPLMLAATVLGLAVTAMLVQAAAAAGRVPFGERPSSPFEQLGLRSLIAVLFVIQPLARLVGRLRHGLTPWRHRGPSGFILPRARRMWIWSERWQSPEVWLGALEQALQATGARVKRASDFDRWDLEVHGGILGAARLLMAIEEHGAGRQLIRFQLRPRWKLKGVAVALIAFSLAASALADGALLTGGSLLVFVVAHLARTVWELGTSNAIVQDAVASLAEGPADAPVDGERPAAAQVPGSQGAPATPLAARQPRHDPSEVRESIGAASHGHRGARADALERDS